ncbi:MAG: Hsp20/alpha crystallin family protein [bacterium]|nr:Hsp20/alpha crystallin family protein [bacterium]
MEKQAQPPDDLFEKMAGQMGSVMDSMMEEMNSRNYFRSSGRDSWDPPTNLYELEDRLVVCADLAGMSCAQIEVWIDQGVLHLRGVRPKPEIPDAQGEISVLVMEIDSGKFHRKIPLPVPVAESQTRASYRNGYVWIVLPRAAPT